MGKTDKNGQPPRAFSYHRNMDKAVESPLGICYGVIADNSLNTAEILFLDAWLREYDDVASCWPGDVIAERVRRILADGTVSAEEAEDLKETLADLVGGGFAETGAVGGIAVRLPVEDVDSICFAESMFCLTGKFLYGPRPKCETAIKVRGGRIATNVIRDLNYLVIGTLCSRDWAYSSHGRKVEMAITHQRQGRPLTILSEEHWLKLLT